MCYNERKRIKALKKFLIRKIKKREQKTMGIWLNPDNTAFQESVNSEIYVDKTMLIAYTNSVIGTEQKNICVSRPRRFGKSMTAKMLAAYYSCGCDSAQIFSRWRISESASYKQFLNQYNVIFINMQDFFSRTGQVIEMLECLEKSIISELQKRYHFISESDKNLVCVLEKIYQEDKSGFVFIIDEWDCIFREKMHDKGQHTKYLDFLRALFKDKTYVKLAYMTGILPIKKYGTHSALNMFDEYSMTNTGIFAEYTGFTEDEVHALCEKYNMDYQEAMHWYDGYLVEESLHIYNPKSIVDAMRRKRFDNYWTQTETYEALKIYIEMNFDGLKDAIVTMLGGGSCRINSRTFQNDMTTFQSKDDVLTLLVHLGYLSYNSEEKRTFIPNAEIVEEFANTIEGTDWNEVTKALVLSEKLLESTYRQDEKTVAELIDEAHGTVTSVLNYNDENVLSCVIHIAYFSAQNYYSLVREMPAGLGFADVVFCPRKKYADRPAMVIELKWDKTATGAIRQIKDKKYLKALKGYTGKAYLVGINYDKKSKKHTCKIEVETIY